MEFSKIKFKEIINETTNETSYQINDKFVTKEVYDSMEQDEYLYILPPLPKMNGSPENSNISKPSNVTNINKYSSNDSEYNSDNEECDCPQCQELLDIIYTIREMDDYEAKELLTNYIDAIKTKTGLETSTEIYSQLGNGMIKVSAQLDVQLDSFMSQFDVIEEE